MVEGCQPRGDLVFLAFDTAAQRGVNVWPRVLHRRNGHRPLGAAERVAGVRVLQFDNRANIPCAQRRHSFSDLSVEQINLADLLRGTPRRVVQFAAELHRPGIHAKERELTELRFAHRLEHVEHRLGIGQGDLDIFSIHIVGRDLLAIHRR